MSYDQQYQQSLIDPNGYWLDKAKQISWYKMPSIGLNEKSNDGYSWFDDGVLNTCYLAVDQHVEKGRGNQIAFYYDSPAAQVKQQISYAQLQQQVSTFAGAMRDLGIVKGDRVIIYMPMIPQAAIAMLACARIGAVHSVVFGGFAAHELAIRIDDAQAKLIITASCGIEFDRIIPYQPLVNKAIQLAVNKPLKTIVLQREMSLAELDVKQQISWSEFVKNVIPADCIAVKSNDPLYILYTSGTTGKPKGIVRDNGGHAVALKLAFNDIYGMSEGDVWWAASDIGWVVGHSFIIYGPLICGASSVFYEGKPIRTPDSGAFWRIINEYKVNSMICAPTAFRAIRKEDPIGEYVKKYDLTSLRWVFVAGEKLDSSTYQWLSELLQVPILDHWWQTETGWPMTAPMMGWDNPAPARLGSTNKCTPGYDIKVLSIEGEEVSIGEVGNICLKLPLPPGASTAIWNQPDRYKDAYLSLFKGYYHTGDGGYKDDDDYIYITGRTDDVINVSGHRLSTGEMEEVVSTHTAVAECAVIGVHDSLKGQIPIGLVVLKAGVEIEIDQLQRELVADVRRQIGALACFKRVFVVQRLPKTRSGKILRAVLRKIAANETYQAPSTIDDPAILQEIEQLLSTECQHA
ncbi:MAG: putative acetyl-coa synthetase [Osedax symbiont Rs1]|nr:MAG: putative acetyl-coa synthetase [Osedax symbiont Rs1]